MPAYIIVYRESPVTDPAAIEQYGQMNRANAQMFSTAFGVQPLAVSGATEGLEGATPDGVVILQFPTMDDARAWYHSPAYQQAAALRRQAADWRLVLVEGLPG